MWYFNANHPLRRLFAGLAENAFMETLGMGDPGLIDYVSLLLSRFIHVDAFTRLKDATGKPLEEVADMLLDLQSLPQGGSTQREVHRHIGDVTLFWTGVYPEALRRL